jgi:hypothetical protein
MRRISQKAALRKRLGTGLGESAGHSLASMGRERINPIAADADVDRKSIGSWANQREDEECAAPIGDWR